MKYGGTDVPVFWLAEVEVSRLLRSAPGIKMRQGNIKTTSLEKILSWSKMKPLKHNPGEVLNMWAAKHHRALVILIIEVGFHLIQEDPNLYVRQDLQATKKPSKKAGKGDERVALGEITNVMTRRVPMEQPTKQATQGIIDKKAGQKVSAKQVDQGVQRRYSQDQLNFLDNLAFDSIDEEDFAPSPKLLKQADDLLKTVLPISKTPESVATQKAGLSSLPALRNDYEIVVPEDGEKNFEMADDDNTYIEDQGDVNERADQYPLPNPSTHPSIQPQEPASPLHQFLQEYSENVTKNISTYGKFLQITKIEHPLTSNEMITLYLSDGADGITAKLPVDFFSKALGGKLEQHHIIKILKSTGHATLGNLIIVSFVLKYLCQLQNDCISELPLLSKICPATPTTDHWQSHLSPSSISSHKTSQAWWCQHHVSFCKKQILKF